MKKGRSSGICRKMDGQPHMRNIKSCAAGKAAGGKMKYGRAGTSARRASGRDRAPSDSANPTPIP
jgi:hypothetical protein